MKLIIGIGLSLLIHWLLGWVWTGLAGVVVGFWVGPRGWLYGGLAVAICWGIFIAYTLIIDPPATYRMVKIIGDIFGGMPGLVVPVGSVLMGGLLGASGGLLGTGLKQVWAVSRR